MAPRLPSRRNATKEEPTKDHDETSGKTNLGMTKSNAKAIKKGTGRKKNVEILPISPIPTSDNTSSGKELEAGSETTRTKTNDDETTTLAHGGGVRSRRTKQKVNYEDEDASDTDLVSDSEESENEGVVVVTPVAKNKGRGTQKRASAVVKTSAHQKKRKVKLCSTPSVRPPDGSSPRNIVGREEPSPEDWRVTVVQDY